MPQTFTAGDIDRLARLARLALTADEKELFARQCEEFLAYAEQLQRVPTRDVPATSHPLAAAAPMRADDVRPSLPREIALAAAPEPDPQAGLFKVPRVIGG